MQNLCVKTDFCYHSGNTEPVPTLTQVLVELEYGIDSLKKRPPDTEPCDQMLFGMEIRISHGNS